MGVQLICSRTYSSCTVQCEEERRPRKDTLEYPPTTSCSSSDTQIRGVESGTPPNLLLLQGQLDEDLLQFFIDVVDAELLKPIFLHRRGDSESASKKRNRKHESPTTRRMITKIHYHHQHENDNEDTLPPSTITRILYITSIRREKTTTTTSTNQPVNKKENVKKTITNQPVNTKRKNVTKTHYLTTSRYRIVMGKRVVQMRTRAHTPQKFQNRRCPRLR